jgi:hypothetical protein
VSSVDYSSLVSKVWSYAHVLRDQGISYGDYVEQITFLLFLKMDQERSDLLNEASIIPPNGARSASPRSLATTSNFSTGTPSRTSAKRRASSAPSSAKPRTNSPIPPN